MPPAAPVTSAMRVASGLGFGIRCSLASSSAQYSILNFSDSSIGEYVDKPFRAAHHIDRIQVELTGTRAVCLSFP